MKEERHVPEHQSHLSKWTGYVANERKDQYPRTGWGYSSWHPSVCTTNFTNLHSLLSLSTSTPLLCLSCLQRLQTSRSVLTDTTGNSGRVQSQSLHIYSSNSCLKIKPCRTHFKVQHCFPLTSGFLSPAAFITPKASS